MGIQNVYELLIYIVPGFIANEIYGAKYPGKKISDLDKIIWSLIYTIIILALIQLFPWIKLTELQNNSSLILISFILILSGIIFGGLLILWRKVRTKLGFLSPAPISVWSNVLEKFESCWVIVTLTDGKTRFIGWVSLYTSDPNEVTQELYLKEVQVVDIDNRPIRNIGGDGIFLKTDQIQSMEIWE